MFYRSILFIFICVYFNVTCLKNIPGLVLQCNKKMQKGHVIDDCEIIPSKNTVVINNYKNKAQPVLNPLSSVCIKCLLCTTVAKELNINFKILQSSYRSKVLLPEEQINTTTEFFCKNNFKKFDLRELKQERGLHVPSKLNKHVISGLDGVWHKKLQEMCLTLIDLHGPWYIYQKWTEESQNGNFQMISILCRSQGLFGHCNNINQDFTPNSTTFPLIDKTHSKYT